MNLKEVEAHFRSEVLEFMRQGFTHEQLILVLQELKVEIAMSLAYRDAAKQGRLTGVDNEQ